MLHSTDSVPACETNRKHSAIDRAKKSIAPRAELKDWLSDSSAVSSAVASDSDSIQVQVHEHVDVCHDTVTFDNGGLQLVYRDNVTRIPGCSFTHDVHGDSLPHVPAVLTGLMDDWLAVLRPFSNPAAAAATCSTSTTIFKTALSLDGGPSFARMSMGQGKV